MSRSAARAPRLRRLHGSRRLGLAAASVLTLALVTPMAGPAVAAGDGVIGPGGPVEVLGAASSSDAADESTRKRERGTDLAGTTDRTDDPLARAAQAAEARRTAEDRALLMASTWEPDLALLEPQEGDSEETAAVRASLAQGVEQLRTAVRQHERAIARAGRAQKRLDTARDALTGAILETAAARRQVEKDRAGLMSLMTETYRNGSAGSLSLLLSGSDPGDEERYAGESLFSGLTLLSQMSSSQDDALRAVRASARALAEVEAREESVRDAAEERAAATDKAVARAERGRAEVLTEVEGLQDLVREAVLRDEVKARQDAARAEREQLLAEDRAFVTTFAGLVPGADSGLLRAAARLASVSPGGVVFPVPEDAGWFDNDNWGGSGSHWAAGHTGNDFSAACGTPVLASTRGTVTVRTDQGWSGRWLVVVQGDDGVAATWYAHMSELLVEDGERVRAGQRIGSVGSEGNSTGCHLHFEVHPLGGSIYEDNVDPHEFLRLSGAYPVD